MQNMKGERSRSSFITLIIGCIDVILGLIGISSFLILDVRERHSVLFPFDPHSKSLVVENTELSDTQTRLDAVGESYQFLLEFWLPSLFSLILGLTLIVAATSSCRCLALLSFVLSTLLVAGCVATLMSLLIGQKLTLLGFIPLLLVTLLQIYFYLIVGQFWLEAEARINSEDKEMLVFPSSSNFKNRSKVQFHSTQSPFLQSL